MMSREFLKKSLYTILFFVCCIPGVSPALALAIGITFGLTSGSPWPHKSATWSKKLLQLSVIGLGFGIGIGSVLTAGKSAITYTVIGIGITMATGHILGRVLKTPREVATLVSFGTAICGGSAIAAMAPVIGAKDDETAVSLATIFTLNAVALLLFPILGHMLNLNESQFGLWSALAIHDTSSVVGAASAFGATALAIAVTVKLARALWIIPCTAASAIMKKDKKKLSLPLFIFGFIAAAAVRSLFPDFAYLWQMLGTSAKQLLVATLFLIGSGLTREVVRQVGLRPLVHGLLLWLIVSTTTLAAIVAGMIHM